MAFTLQDFFSGLAGKDLESTQLKRAQVEAAQMELANAKAQREGEMATARTLADIANRQGGTAEQQGGLMGLGGTPDLVPQNAQAPQQSGMFGGAFGAPQGQSETQRLQLMVANNDAAIQELTKSGDVYQMRAAEKLKKDNIALMEKLPDLRAKELDTRLKTETANYNRLAGIVDDQSLNMVMADTSPEERAALAKNYGIVPSFGTGLYSFNTPEVQTLLKGAKSLSLTQVQRLEEQKRREDTINQERNRVLEEQRNAETARANRAREAIDRENARLRGREVTLKEAKGDMLDMPKPDKGYRYKADGSGDQELIPGGAAYNKMKSTAMKESKLLDSAVAGFDSTIAVIDKLIGSEDKTVKPIAGLESATGMTGVALRRIPGLDARQVQALLKTLESKIAFGELQKMRSESPTGGALGQVAVKELELLRDSINPIDPTVSKKDFEENLARIRSAINASKSRIRTSFEETYAPLGVGKPKSPQAPSGDGVDTSNPLLR